MEVKENSKLEITIILPTRNEGEGIVSIIESVKLYVDEILVIDGHSTDDTRAKAEAAGAKVVQDNGMGKGAGLRLGITEAKGDIIVFFDADGSHNPHDIPAMIDPIKQGIADMVVGSRAKGGSDEFEMNMDSLIRQMGSHIVTTIINYRFNSKLTDVENGFRAIKKDVAVALDLNANDFDIEQEMVMKAFKKKYRVTEIASHEFARKWGKSKLATTKGWKFIWRLIIEL